MARISHPYALECTNGSIRYHGYEDLELDADGNKRGLCPIESMKKLIWTLCLLSLGSQGCDYRWTDSDLEPVRKELTQKIGLSDQKDPPTARQVNEPEPLAPVDSTQADPGLSSSDRSTPWIDPSSLPILQWEIIYLGNRPVGYTRRSIEIPTMKQLQAIDGLDLARVLATKDFVCIEAESRIRISRKTGPPVDQNVSIKTIESLDGQLIGISGSLDTGVTKRLFQGAVKDGALTIEQNEDKVTSKVSVPWEKSLRGPFAIEQSLRAQPMQLKEVRNIRYLDPFQIGITESRLEALAQAETTDFEGELRSRLEIENRSTSRAGASNSLLWTDQEGVVRKTYTPGIDRQTYDCDPVTARYVISKDEFDATSLKSLPLLGSYTKVSDTGFAIFRVASGLLSKDGAISNRTNQMPLRVNDRTWDIEVSQTGVGIDLSNDLPDQANLASAGLIDYKDPFLIKWIQTQTAEQTELDSKQPQTGGRAAQVAQQTRRQALSARAWVSKAVSRTELDRNLQTPAVTLRQRKGDSLDHAFLMTAVLRSLKIPARIAIGFKAEPSTVRPTCQLHFWVEYFDSSQWVSIDSTIDSELVPTDRFKITESSFASINAYEPILGVTRLITDIEIAARTKRP